MRKTYSFLLAALITVNVFAQVPQKMSYQAVIRNAGNTLVTNHIVGMRISILKSSAIGNIVYSETQTPTTNDNGLVSIEIGGGAGFDAIDWSDGAYFIKTETDPAGGTNYSITGTSQLLSVPYALRAGSAGNGFSGSYLDLTNKPVLFNGQYSGLTGSPTTIAGYGITDAMTILHPANSITSTNITNWTTAFSWGNHANAGYLTTFNETDPKIGANTSGYSPKWDGTSFVSGSIYQDVSGNIGVGTASPGAAMDISSTSSGILIPRMTTAERDLIASPPLGLQIYNISINCFNVWNGSSWGQLCPDCGFIPVVGNNGPICAGLTLNLTAETIVGATYSWTGPNGFTSSLQNPTIPNSTTVESGAYYVTATLNGCTSPAGSTVVTITPSLGTITSGYNSPVCVGSTLNFSPVSIPGASYTWSGPNNYFSNIQNPSISNIQLSHAGTYYVTATAGSCSTSTSVVVTVEALPVQPGVITGLSSLLPVQTGVAYSIASVPGAASYTWAYSGSGATINGQGTNSISVDFACGATGGNLTVRANNICGGSGPAQSQSIMIATLAQPETITGPSSIVLPQTGVVYSVPVVSGATSYTWTVPGTLGSIVSGQGTNTISVDYVCGATGGLISVAATNGCGSSIVRTLPVNIYSLSTPGTINGLGTITYPQSGVSYSVPSVAGATTYTWTVPTGATIASGQGSNSILVTYACGSLSGNLSVTASNSCGSGGTNSMSVTISTSAPLTPGAISGTNNLPGGVTGVNYSITPVTGATGYTWITPTGADIISGQGTTSITVNYTCAAVSGNISVTSTNGCGTSSARTFAITVNSTPAQPGVITGITSIPQGSTAIPYSIATVTGATSYTWSYTGTGATIASGQGTNAVTVAFACGATNGNIVVNASNTCGTPGADRTTGITITGTIATPGAITGTNVPLFGQLLTPYSVVPVNGATSYNWIVPSGATIFSGQGTNSILVDFGCAAVNGNISVTANNGCIGAGTPSNLAVTLSSTIPQPSVITGQTSVPQGKTGISYSIAPVAGATTYTWSYTGTGATIPTGQGTTSIIVDYACSATNGNISVTASNGCIAPGVARTLGVTINTLSTPGTITGLASLPQGSTGINYTISPVAGATSYTWIVPIGATVVSGQGTTSVLVDYSCTAGSGNILVTANNACGSSGGSSMNITLTSTLGGPAWPNSVPNSAIYIGTTDVMFSTNLVTGANSYFWTVSPGAIIVSGQGTTNIQVEYPCSSAQASQQVTVTAKNNCLSSTPTVRGIYLYIAPTGGITGPATLPKGTIANTYSVAPVKGATSYNWNVPAGATITSGQGTPVITVDYSGSAVSGTMSVSATNSCGTSTNSNLGITINPSIANLGVITGTTSPLYGQTGVQYSVVPVTGVNTYTWSVPGSATVSSGQGTASVIVDFPCSATNGTIVVSGSNTTLSTPPVSLAFALSTAALAQPAGITGPSSVPRGGSGVVYSIPAVTGATSYTWSAPANATIVSGQGTTTISVDYTNCSIVSGTLSVIATNSCVPDSPPQTLPISITITALPRPGVITGLQTPIPGQTGLVYSIVPVTGATTYTWSYSGTGATITSGQGSPSISVDYACTATNGNISVTAGNGCVPTSPAQSLAITQGNTIAAPGTIIGIQSPLFGQNGVSYSVYPVAGATSYNWAVTSGATIISGQGTRTVVVDFSCTAAINGTITVYASNSCGINSPQSALSYAMAGSLDVPGVISGFSSVPAGTNNLIYSITSLASATSYTWSVPGGCTIIEGQGTRLIKVNFSCSAVTGNISVTATNACTTTTARTLAVTVTSTLPVPGAITGPASPKFGSSVNYSVFPVAGAVSYNWTAPAGATITSGAGTNSVWYSFACGASSGNISVTVNNSCIVAGSPATLAITTGASSSINTVGAITEIITGSNNRQYSVVPVGDAIYNWTVPAGVTIVSGQGSPVIGINYSGSVSDNISVTVTNTCLSQSSTSNLIVNLTMGAYFSSNGTGPTGSIQTFIVPAGVTSITIDAYGAQGGNTYNALNRGGKGARIKGTFAVTPGDVLKILVGQQGTGLGTNNYGGGGGGTFVATPANIPLVVAGGGGGGNAPSATNGLDAVITTTGGSSNRGISGGTGGNGGNGGVAGGGGGGFYTDGAYGSICNFLPGLSFLNGGTGAIPTINFLDTGSGGFGGGGSGDGNCCGVGGAGGGYSGGGGGGGPTCGQAIGGGGGSYNAGTTQSNTGGVQVGDGRVIITW